MGLIRYLQIGVVIALVSSGFYIKHLIGVQAVLKYEQAELKAEIKSREDNMKLLVIQLDKEAEYRQIAESALVELYKDVPDVEYQTDLPPNIQGVLDRFHSRIRPSTP